MTSLPQASHLMTSAFHKNVLYSICIDKMHFFSVLSNKGAVQLPGDDARFCMCRIVVASPLLLTTRYGFPPYVCEGIVVLEQYELRRIPICLKMNLDAQFPLILFLVAAFVNGVGSLRKSN
jgi:hypothetical protein